MKLLNRLKKKKNYYQKDTLPICLIIFMMADDNLSTYLRNSFSARHYIIISKTLNVLKIFIYPS